MNGLLAKKLGMTQIYDKDGNVIPVTVIESDSCYVLSLKKDAVQLGFGVEKKPNKPLQGIVKKAGLSAAPKWIKEIKVTKVEDYKPGQEIKVDIFKPGDKITVVGKSIGKGFAGTVKRHNFSRGLMSHGSKSHRLPGSIGAGTTPGRVFKGTKMAGHMGQAQISQKYLEVVVVDPARNLLMVKGPVPGKKNSRLVLKKVN